MSEHMALENLTVLDLTRVLAGPFCTMMLADMGANVIKIEVPKGGDDTRSYPPFRAKNLRARRSSRSLSKKRISWWKTTAPA